MSHSDQSKSGVWFVLMAATLWGTTGTAQAFAPVGFDPMVIGTLRLAIGGGAMLLLVLLQGGVSQLRGWPLKTTIAAAAFTALYQVCFFAGVAKTGVAVGTIVGIGSSPVAGGILDTCFAVSDRGATGSLRQRWRLSVASCLFSVVVAK